MRAHLDISTGLLLTGSLPDAARVMRACSVDLKEFLQEASERLR